ncbi:MAG: DNA repair protein RecO [Patescibacteria group bacterium]|nr:DNA repair protein RecO [Patescibacteria group bacterium]
MPREIIYNAIILKKQPFGEADEMVTAFTREAGKIRAVAKSSKYSKSKLQYLLQPLFYDKLNVVSAMRIPRIIGGEVRKPFAKIRESLEASKKAFYALEATLKFTADEHKNETLFSLLDDYFDFLNKTCQDNQMLGLGLAKFKINFLQSAGLSVHSQTTQEKQYVGFSIRRGGFVSNGNSADARPVPLETFNLFLRLQSLSFSRLREEAGSMLEIRRRGLPVLQALLTEFLTFHLERDIKSEKFLNGEGVV